MSICTQILQLIEGVKKARGLTVVIDVFRAFTFEPYAFSRGVKKIIPVGTYEQAMALKEKHPEYLVAGEDKGEKLPNFDFGNSPSEIENLDLTGKTLVHRSSAGIQGIVNAKNADEIITASFVNADAVVKYILAKNPETVSLCCMGLLATSETEEDTLCAEYIKDRLQGGNRDFTNDIKDLKFTSGAKFFDEKQRSVFPQRDFELCTKLNTFDFVLKAKNIDGQIVIEKV